MFDLIWKMQRSSVMNSIRKLSFSYRSIVSSNSAYWLFYQPYIWWGKMKMKAVGMEPKERVVRPKTELVIDGFQGSANSFATQAFKDYQTKSVELSHHMHSPTQIVKAIEQGVPVLLTLRDPISAVLSLTSRWPHLSVNQGLKSYIRFYSQIEPYAGQCVVSTFEQTINHLDQIIIQINSKFGTDFDLVNVEKANADYKTRIPNINYESEIKLNRKLIKEQKKAELSQEINLPLLERAKVIYDALQKNSQNTTLKRGLSFK